jgi:glycerol-3-phosphate dehydrogenase
MARIIERAGDDPALQRIIHEPSGAIAAEVVFAVETEHATNLHDVLFRRTMIGYGADAGQSALDSAGEIQAAYCGWSPQRLQTQRGEILGFLKASMARGLG